MCAPSGNAAKALSYRGLDDEEKMSRGGNRAPFQHKFVRNVAARKSTFLFRQRFPRELLVDVRRVPREDRRDGTLLNDVVFLHVIEQVHVRVVRARVVFEALLDELKARDAGFVERSVIGL